MCCDGPPAVRAGRAGDSVPLLHMPSARHLDRGAPGRLAHRAGMLVLGTQPGPRSGSVGSSPHGLLLPTGGFGFFAAWWLDSKSQHPERQEVEAASV